MWRWSGTCFRKGGTCCGVCHAGVACKRSGFVLGHVVFILFEDLRQRDRGLGGFDFRALRSAGNNGV